jgi:hypothetical protein
LHFLFSPVSILVQIFSSCESSFNNIHINKYILITWYRLLSKRHVNLNYWSARGKVCSCYK